jgi:hypothetical protein
MGIGLVVGLLALLDGFTIPPAVMPVLPSRLAVVV